MILSGLITSDAVRRLVGCALLLAAGAGLVLWGLSPRIDLARQEAAWSAEGLQKAHEMLEEKDAQLREAQQQAERLAKVDQAIAQLRQDVSKYSSAQSRAFEELKQNDEAVARYLDGVVPGGLGRLYERPETTDPRAYGSPEVLRPGTVSSAGAAGAHAQ